MKNGQPVWLSVVDLSDETAFTDGFRERNTNKSGRHPPAGLILFVIAGLPAGMHNVSYSAQATASISTSASFGSRATCTALRAG